MYLFVYSYMYRVDVNREPSYCPPFLSLSTETKKQSPNTGARANNTLHK